MMESLHRYRALSAADRRLIVEAAMLLAVARLGIIAMSFPVLRRALDRAARMHRRRPGGTSDSSVARLGWAVGAVARRAPFRSTCLVESLAADAMLRRRGYASEIRIGVRPPSGGVLAAHAWVEHEGAVVFGAVHELAEIIGAVDARVRPHYTYDTHDPYAPFMTMPIVPAALVAMVRGEPVPWRALGVTREEFFALCDREELRGLLFSRLATSDAAADWPAEIRDELAHSAREDTAREMVRREEIAAVLSELAAGGAPAIVLKGTALAYSVYEAPIARPRLDTDLLIDSAHQYAARRVLETRGYAAPPYCDQLFSQFHMEKTDGFGVPHVLDVHWKISTQPIFADVLTHEDMRSRAVPIPALGPAAYGPSAIDALLLACIHPVMHHQNTARILWAYDSHLLASRLTAAEFATFARRARQHKIAAVCAHALRLAHGLFGTVVPPDVMGELSTAADEPSAEYLASHRRWHHEMASSVRGTPRFADRARLVREVLLPKPSYMIGVYGLHDRPLTRLLLPALYVHRNVRGAWKILMGKK